MVFSHCLPKGDNIISSLFYSSLVLFVIITLKCNEGSGMMNQKDKERKERVAHIINIPDEYSLVVDDQEGVDDPYHLLWWEHKEDQERTIQITLNRHTGNLIEFRIDDGNYFSSDKEVIEENRVERLQMYL